MPALFAPRTVAPTAARPVRSVVLAASVACATWAAHSAPAAPGTSNITQVTLYPGSATVERVAKVTAGARSLTLACLPASLDVQSLQINADPAAPCPCATAGTAWLHSVRRTKDTLATPWA